MPEENDPPQTAPPAPLMAANWNVFAPAGSLAGGSQSASATGNARQTWTPPALEEASTLFPGYEVLRLLGRGGMGAVYQARQIELDRFVAIKLLPLEISVDKSFADRFRREAQAMARLHHPNIITVFDFGATRKGHLYFVMEYVEGADLFHVIHQNARSGPSGLGCEEALEIVEQVCTALDYAHEKGIVHRDMKPANVMIDSRRRVKVADFGLARLVDTTATDLGHTTTGMVMGTPDYMAPEQMRGMNVDRRADIYSVGVMLYEMLCGEVPRGSFDAPSRRIGCDPRLDQIVIRATQQSAESRYQSTQEMRAAVERVRSLRTPRKSRTPLFASLGVLAAAAAAAALFFFPHPQDAKRNTTPDAAMKRPSDRDRSASDTRHKSGAAVAAAAPTATGDLVPSDASAHIIPVAIKAAPTPIGTAPSREASLNAATGAAREVEGTGDWGKSLEAWVHVAKDFPESPMGKKSLVRILSQLRVSRPPITFEMFQSIRKQITDAAELDIPEAMLVLGDNLVHEDPGAARDWYTKAAAKGSAAAETELGLMDYHSADKDLLTDKDKLKMSEAIKHFQTAADNGDLGAKVSLSRFYRNGTVVPQDLKKAIRYLNEAAEAGDPVATNDLGDCYLKGEGVVQDEKLAFTLFQKAVKLGLVSAKGNLGELYMKGWGTKADPKTAFGLFAEGAKQGDSFCMELYARSFELGEGVPKNALTAASWYVKAAAAGDEIAAKWCHDHPKWVPPGD